MRISQCHISKSVADFPWLQIYSLDDYGADNQPAVFFGMYRYEDASILLQHKSEATVFWTGQDVLQEKWKSDPRVFGFRNVTAHPKVAAFIRSKRYDCELVAPSSFLNRYKPQPLGTKVYAYCPNSMLSYHGKSVLDELRRGGMDITVGDGTISQEDWRSEKSSVAYQDICIGLCLSSFAGGGTSIIEMGLRGVRVVTNVFTMPHTIPWVDEGDAEQSAQQINVFIMDERKRAGTTNPRLARKVYKSLDHEFKWLEI